MSATLAALEHIMDQNPILGTLIVLAPWLIINMVYVVVKYIDFGKD